MTELGRPLVYRWDLDKTYLRTEFDRLGDLWRTVRQTAEEKQSVPGAAALLRALGGHERTARVDFISGSPTQMRKVLEEKLRLDGVRVDGFTLKPNLQNLLRGRFRALREQVGYKLPALLQARLASPPDADEVCFGDDAEADAFIYRLYADVVAGRVDGDQLTEVMTAAGAYASDVKRTVALLPQLPTPRDSVRRIFINLDRRSPTAGFDVYGPRVVPVHNYFQAALVLFEDGVLAARDLVRVGLEMVRHDGYSISRLVNSMEDLLRRGRMTTKAQERFNAQAHDVRGDLPDADAVLREFHRRVVEVAERPRGVARPDEPVDFLAILQATPLRRHRKKVKAGPLD
ncbi:MAG: phosphatase domain-containing protein [Myxococcota bacterium]